MQSTKCSTSAVRFCGITTVLLCWLSVFSVIANAQGSGNQQGENAVCSNSSGCATPVGSPVFIDASMFKGNATDICAVLNFILLGVDKAPTYPNGAVIDARGLNSSNTSMTCTASPWAGITNAPPATILLPAGTILIPHPGWILPANTRLIGVGNDSIASTGAVIPATSIQACQTGQTGCPSAFLAGDTMITMCSKACSGVSVENLSLDGQGQTINGIANAYAGAASSAASSYVKNVSLLQMVGTGLSVTGSTQGSGPYTNITFDTNNIVSSSTICLNLTASGTQGFHGLTCSSTNTAPTAVLLDASNTSLTDVQIIGFTAGVVVGSRSTASSDVLRNVWGDTDPSKGINTPLNGVVILGGNARDLAAVGTGNNGNNPTILDPLTSTTIYDSYVGIYALGESVPSAGYTRFTTSTNTAANGNGNDSNAVTWGTGLKAPTAAASGPACAEGSLYSCTGTTTTCTGPTACGTVNQSAALWVCGNKSSTLGWCAIQ